MIDFIKGEVQFTGTETLVVDMGKVGFEITASVKTIGSLKTGDECVLFTSLIVREDGMQLFGFKTREERHMFRLITTVTGFGPKAAIAVLSAYSPGELAMHIVREDADALTSVRGIGKKNAGRLILELKDKIRKGRTGTETAISGNSPPGAQPNEMNEACSALAVLGYADKDIKKAVSGIHCEGMSVEEILREALKII